MSVDELLQLVSHFVVSTYSFQNNNVEGLHLLNTRSDSSDTDAFPASSSYSALTSSASTADRQNQTAPPVKSTLDSQLAVAADTVSSNLQNATGNLSSSLPSAPAKITSGLQFAASNITATIASKVSGAFAKGQSAANSQNAVKAQTTAKAQTAAKGQTTAKLKAAKGAAGQTTFPWDVKMTEQTVCTDTCHKAVSPFCHMTHAVMIALKTSDICQLRHICIFCMHAFTEIRLGHSIACSEAMQVALSLHECRGQDVCILARVCSHENTACLASMFASSSDPDMTWIDPFTETSLSPLRNSSGFMRASLPCIPLRGLQKRQSCTHGQLTKLECCCVCRKMASVMTAAQAKKNRCFVIWAQTAQTVGHGLSSRP